MLLISTGKITAPNGQGIVVEGVNSQYGKGLNDNLDNPDTMPAPLSDKVGSKNGAGGTPFLQCDGVNDCSDSLVQQWNLGDKNPNDKLFFRFNTTVPMGTFGYKFDFVFCSSETDPSYNDMFIAWQTDPSADDPNSDPPVDPYTGNIVHIPDPNNPGKVLPPSVSTLGRYLDVSGYSGNEPQLAGTGFETRGCTGWLTAMGGVRPGAALTIGFFLSDMRDHAVATQVILDKFRWDCEGCDPGEVDDCGVQTP